MRRLIRAIAILAVMMAAGLSLPFARAATPEEVYITPRDAAIVKIKAAAEKRDPMDNYGADILVVEKQARAGLEKQMRTIVGPVAIKAMEENSALNLDTLIEGDEGFGLLDDMVYGPVNGKTRVIVTTNSMFKRWLHQHKDWWSKDSADIPHEPSAAVKENAFYTQAVLPDAAIMRFAELPIRKPVWPRSLSPCSLREPRARFHPRPTRFSSQWRRAEGCSSPIRKSSVRSGCNSKRFSQEVSRGR
jgi:hypothetical protein